MIMITQVTGLHLLSHSLDVHKKGRYNVHYVAISS
jgi:hypothetical protein